MIILEDFLADVIIHTLVILAVALFVRARGGGDVVWMAVAVAVTVSVINRYLFPWATLRNLFHQ